MGGSDIRCSGIRLESQAIHLRQDIAIIDLLDRLRSYGVAATEIVIAAVELGGADANVTAEGLVREDSVYGLWQNTSSLSGRVASSRLV